MIYRKWSAACSLACSQATGKSSDTFMPLIVTLGWAVGGSPATFADGWSPAGSTTGGSLTGATAAELVTSVASPALE